MRIPGATQHGSESDYRNSVPDPSSIQRAQQAASSGQKEIFDTAMLGPLLSATRDDMMVDRYLGDIFRGMDRIGRILFQFYWHRDDMAERYGKSDMPELEDMLRNDFTGAGKLILKLKQKMVDTDVDAAFGRTGHDGTGNSAYGG